MANSRSGDSVVDRIARLLSAFPHGSDWLPLGELARRSGLPLATTHRLVAQLAAHGFVESQQGSVRIGVRLWEVTHRSSSTLMLRDAARPVMEDIHSVLRQNVNLAVLDGDDALFVERLSRPGSARNRARVAGRLPAQRSSAGLVLLAHARRGVNGDLAEVRRQGFAQLEGAFDAGTWGIAVPVFAPGAKPEVVAALGVVVPIAEVTLPALVPVLQTAARGITRRLTAHAPSIQ